ncbi:hypothetical protein GJ496_005841 [Pomphorhynchus laevis]|nr:hypothetical protein GJ496_005841 [Pomphorhynchus laevis]
MKSNHWRHEKHCFEMFRMYLYYTIWNLWYYGNADNSIPKLLLISFDGFRHDYIERYNLSTFKRFMENGGSAKRVKSSFATVTFPNHFSIATGLYEDRHGIINNQMYDPDTNETFDMNNADTKCNWWKQNPHAVPIWIHNQIESAQRSSGTICWVSSQCSFKSKSPDRQIPCNGSKTATHKIDTVFQWFTNESHPINFAAVYFNEPDNTGHEHGPNSDKMKITLKNLEIILDYIDTKIAESNLTQTLNVVIVSDHGMTDVYPNNSIVLCDYIDRNMYKAYGSLTVKVIFPVSEDVEPAIFRNLSFLSNYKVYRTRQLQKYHYSNNSRLGSLIIIADPGYLIFKSNISLRNSTQKGNHGYLNNVEDMHTIFMAKGPSFRPNSSIDYMKIVDIFPLLVELLKLDSHISMQISSINKFDVGSLQTTAPLLNYVPQDHNVQPRSSTLYFLYFAMACTILLGIVTTVGIIKAGLNMFFPGRWLLRHWTGTEDSLV